MSISTQQCSASLIHWWTAVAVMRGSWERAKPGAPVWTHDGLSTLWLANLRASPHHIGWNIYFHVAKFHLSETSWSPEDFWMVEWRSGIKINSTASGFTHVILKQPQVGGCLQKDWPQSAVGIPALKLPLSQAKKERMEEKLVGQSREESKQLSIHYLL